MKKHFTNWSCQSVMPIDTNTQWSMMHVNLCNSPGSQYGEHGTNASCSVICWLHQSVNQALATLAFFGIGVNLVLFLTRVVGQNNAEAANNVSKWTGTVYIFSLVGAFLSDSYWGRYKTCAVFQVIFVIVSNNASIFSPFLVNFYLSH